MLSSFVTLSRKKIATWFFKFCWVFLSKASFLFIRISIYVYQLVLWINRSNSNDLDNDLQKEPLRGVPRKRFSENIQQIYRRHPCRSAISIKLQRNIIEIKLRHECSPANLLHIFRTAFLKNTSRWLLLDLCPLCFTTHNLWRMVEAWTYLISFMMNFQSGVVINY